MTTFFVLSALLTALVTAWLIWPLLQSRTQSTVSSVELNASIYREHLQGLERDFASGQLDAAELENARTELQLRLLEDARTEPQPKATQPDVRGAAKKTALVLALLLPMGGAAGYWWLGTPSAVDPLAARRASQAQIEQMVEQLATKLQANPDNPQGWAMLGRSYKVLGRYDAAAQAYARAGKYVESSADMLVEYADVLALSRESNLQGLPTELLSKALAIDPKHPMALLMAGVSAYQRDDYPAAIARWETLLRDLEPGSDDAQQVEGNIAQAKQRLAEKTQAPAPRKMAPKP